jgi:TRAP-type mannitol/chloroaromatic compound transport system permease small subunit
MSNQSAITIDGSPPLQVDTAFQKAANMLASLGTVWILALMLLIVADVLGRNFLDQPITGVAEIAGRSVVAIVFLQLPAAVGATQLTRSDFLIQMIGRRAPNVRLFLEILFTLTGMAVFVALAWASWPEFQQSWETAEFFGVQGIFTIPTWPFRGLLILGSVMAALASLVVVKALMSGAKLKDQMS